MNPVCAVVVLSLSWRGVVSNKNGQMSIYLIDKAHEPPLNKLGLCLKSHANVLFWALAITGFPLQLVFGV